jgi:hypothetical protein
MDILLYSLNPFASFRTLFFLSAAVTSSGSRHPDMQGAAGVCKISILSLWADALSSAAGFGKGKSVAVLCETPKKGVKTKAT